MYTCGVKWSQGFTTTKTHIKHITVWYFCLFQYTFHLKNINSKINNFTCSRKSQKVNQKQNKNKSISTAYAIINIINRLFWFRVAEFYLTCSHTVMTNFYTNSSPHDTSHTFGHTCFYVWPLLTAKKIKNKTTDVQSFLGLMDLEQTDGNKSNTLSCDVLVFKAYVTLYLHSLGRTVWVWNWTL